MISTVTEQPLSRLLAPLAPAIVAAACLLLTACRDEEQPPPPVVYEAPDYEPIGDGIKVHSYALIGVAAIITVGLLARSGNH